MMMDDKMPVGQLTCRPDDHIPALFRTCLHAVVPALGNPACHTNLQPYRARFSQANISVNIDLFSSSPSKSHSCNQPTTKDGTTH